MRCRICGGISVTRTYRLREMMQGTREVFDYFECDNCGCLQIASIPDDMSRYYGSSYYSKRRRGRLKRRLFDLRVNAINQQKPSLVGRGLLRLFPVNTDESVGPPSPISKTDHILEVGCGNGGYLFQLFELGYSHLHGIDPYMDSDDVRRTPFPLEQRTLLDLDPATERFDVVFMGHTLEHIAEQHETVRRIGQLLLPGGVAIVRIPMLPCYAWEHYGTDWVQLDAPRHFFIHTPESLSLLANDAGLRIDDIEYDSNSFQFWGSEQYRMDIALSADNSWSVSPRRSPFDAAKIEAFEEQARQLNRERRGDQVSVRLRPDDSAAATN